MRRSVDFWYLLISLKATVPGLYLCGFLTPPVAGADFLAALDAKALRGALPPVVFLAVCLVLAILNFSKCDMGSMWESAKIGGIQFFLNKNMVFLAKM